VLNIFHSNYRQDDCYCNTHTSVLRHFFDNCSLSEITQCYNKSPL